MKIQQYKKFELDLYRYGLVENSYYQNPISYVEYFLHYFSGYVRREGGPIQFLDTLKNYQGEYGMTFETVDLNFDKEHNIVYLGEIFDAYELDITEQEFNEKYNNMTPLQLCQNKISKNAILSKDNFISLLTKWSDFYDAKKSFVLLYLDDKNWYDSLPFDSQEAMEKFIAEHTQQEII